MIEKVKEFSNLLTERERLIPLIEYLESKLENIDDNKIKQLFSDDKKESEKRLLDIENKIKEAGIPIYIDDTIAIFNQVNINIDKLLTSNQLFNWIKSNSKSDQLDYLLKVEKSQKEFQSKMTGKWLGNFNSSKGYPQGDFVIGLCQIGNKLVGYGATLGSSIYSKIFIKGIVDEDEIKVELSRRNSNFKTFFEGIYKKQNDVSIVEGNFYAVDGRDEGTVMSFIAKDVIIPLSNKNKSQLLLSNLKKKISLGDEFELIDVLNILESTFQDYQNEIVLHKNRLNSLLAKKRIQVLSFSEIQLEESKIISNILNLIYNIELELKFKDSK